MFPSVFCVMPTRNPIINCFIIFLSVYNILVNFLWIVRLAWGMPCTLRKIGKFWQSHVLLCLLAWICVQMYDWVIERESSAFRVTRLVSSQMASSSVRFAHSSASLIVRCRAFRSITRFVISSVQHGLLHLPWRRVQDKSLFINEARLSQSCTSSGQLSVTSFSRMTHLLYLNKTFQGLTWLRCV